MTMMYVGIGTAIVGLIGTGVGFYGQQQAAKSQTAIANYNFAIEKQNAEINAKSTQIQAQWRSQTAAAEQQNQLNNAAALEAQARATEQQGREAAQRMRDENDLRLAKMRSGYAKSGVTTEGTPLTTLADSAGLLELGVQDSAFQTEMNARSYDRQAADERYQAGYSLFDKQIADYQEAAASAGKAIDLNVAQGNLAAAKANAQAANISSYGTLIGGVAQAGSNFASIYKPKP
jgi:archaeosine-15-forming tRNA-guanine transglycosylase